MLARNGISECELLKLIPMKWSYWLNLSDALHRSDIVVTRMGLMSLANKQVSCDPFCHMASSVSLQDEHNPALQ